MRRIRHGTDCMHSMIDGRRARAVVLAGWLAMGCAGPAFAQAPVVTVEDYARAEKFLAHNAKPLVDHAIEPVHWIDDAQFWYRDHAANGARLLPLDAAQGGVGPAAIGSAGGGERRGRNV